MDTRYIYKCPHCNEELTFLQRTITRYSFVKIKSGLFGKPVFEDTGSEEDYFDICPKCCEEIEQSTLIVVEV